MFSIQLDYLMIDDDVAAAAGGLFYSRSRLSHWYGTVDNNFFLVQEIAFKTEVESVCSLFSLFVFLFSFVC